MILILTWAFGFAFTPAIHASGSTERPQQGCEILLVTSEPNARLSRIDHLIQLRWSAPPKELRIFQEIGAILEFLERQAYPRDPSRRAIVDRLITNYERMSRYIAEELTRLRQLPADEIRDLALLNIYRNEIYSLHTQSLELLQWSGIAVPESGLWQRPEFELSVTAANGNFANPAKPEQMPRGVDQSSPYSGWNGRHQGGISLPAARD